MIAVGHHGVGLEGEPTAQQAVAYFRRQEGADLGAQAVVAASASVEDDAEPLGLRIRRRKGR
jgi:poly-gamma-glutamate capsule biosynthesis protein CapA/YwtB (metallophosphatase superfamily)